LDDESTIVLDGVISSILGGSSAIGLVSIVDDADSEVVVSGSSFGGSGMGQLK
jgi:hypothetical protein